MSCCAKAEKVIVADAEELETLIQPIVEQLVKQLEPIIQAIINKELAKASTIVSQKVDVPIVPPTV